MPGRVSRDVLRKVRARACDPRAWFTVLRGPGATGSFGCDPGYCRGRNCSIGDSAVLTVSRRESGHERSLRSLRAVRRRRARAPQCRVEAR